MEERSILKNQVLKTIAFLTLPIFAMIIIVDCIIIYYSVACPEIKENKEEVEDNIEENIQEGDL